MRGRGAIERAFYQRPWSLPQPLERAGGPVLSTAICNAAVAPLTAVEGGSSGAPSDIHAEFR